MSSVIEKHERALFKSLHITLRPLPCREKRGVLVGCVVFCHVLLSNPKGQQSRNAPQATRKHLVQL